MGSNSVQCFVGKKGISILNSTGNFSVQDHVQVSVDKRVLHIRINLTELLYLGSAESTKSVNALVGNEVSKENSKVEACETCTKANDQKICVGNDFDDLGKGCLSLVNVLPNEDVVDVSTKVDNEHDFDVSFSDHLRCLEDT